MPVGRALCTLGSLLAFSGCSNNTTLTASTINTALRVEPEAFLGSLGCLGEPEGSVGAYVATLTRLEAASQERPGDGIHSGRGFALPSSPPVACHVGATFESTTQADAELASVQGGGHYVAEILAFDVPPCDDSSPSPDGGAQGCVKARSPGTPVAVDESGGPLAPRWTAHCGLDPANGILSAGSAQDAGAPQDGGADGPYVGSSYRGDLAPLWTTAQDGRVLWLQGCSVLR